MWVTRSERPKGAKASSAKGPNAGPKGRHLEILFLNILQSVNWCLFHGCSVAGDAGADAEHGGWLVEAGVVQRLCAVQESNNWCSQLQATAEGSSAGRLWSKKGLPGPERLGHGPPPISFTHAVFSKANSWLNLFKNCPAVLTQCIKCDWACGKEAQCYMVSEVGSCTASLSPFSSFTVSHSPTLPGSHHPLTLPALCPLLSFTIHSIVCSFS